MTDPATAARSCGRPLRSRSWVLRGSPLWALMGLLDIIGWFVGVKTEVPRVD